MLAAARCVRAFAHARIAPVGALASTRRALICQSLQVEHQERTHEMVVTAAGPDRLGIVNEVSRAIVSIGGNVGESQSMSVRGTFMAAFAIELDVRVDLTEFCADVTNQLPGFMVSLQPAQPVQTEDAVYTARVVVSMADHIGAVHEVTSQPRYRRRSQRQTVGSTYLNCSANERVILLSRY